MPKRAAVPHPSLLPPGLSRPEAVAYIGVSPHAVRYSSCFVGALNGVPIIWTLPRTTQTTFNGRQQIQPPDRDQAAWLLLSPFQFLPRCSPQDSHHWQIQECEGPQPV